MRELKSLLKYLCILYVCHVQSNQNLISSPANVKNVSRLLKQTKEEFWLISDSFKNFLSFSPNISHQNNAFDEENIG